MKTAVFPTLLGVVLSGLIPLGALAQTVSGAEVEPQVFDPDRAEVVFYDAQVLSDEERPIVTQIAQGQKYYAAMALAPDHGLLHPATVLAANYHDVGAARAAALRECNSLREGGRGCVIVLEVRPAGWAAQNVQMNADATTAFLSDYLSGNGSRAMALSPRTGEWGLGQGPNAAAEALSACSAPTGATDCALRVVD